MRKIKEDKVREPASPGAAVNPVFFGLYTRLIRRSLGYSLDNASKDLHMSKGNLSEMENGIRPMRHEVFHSFLQTYHLPFREDPSLMQVARSLLCELFDFNLRFDDDTVALIEKKYERMRGTLLNSFAHFHVLLIDYFLEVVIHLHTDPQAFDQLILINACLQNDEQALIYFIRGMEYRLQRRYDLQDEAFRKALDLVDEKLLFGLRPLINYYQVQVLTRNANPFEAYVLCGRTRKAFYNMHNYIRALYLDNAEALCLMSCRQYPSALQQLDTMLDNIHFVRDPFLYFCVVQNRILMLTLMDEFEQALETAREGRSIFSAGGLESFALCAYSLYMLGRNEEALRAIVQMKPYAREEEQRLLFRCIQCAVEKPDQLEQTAERMFDICGRIPNYELMELTYKLMIRYYLLNSQQEKLLDIQTRYIAFLNRLSSRTQA